MRSQKNSRLNLSIVTHSIFLMLLSLRSYYAAGLVVRVLYRLRFLSEQAPFDAATFSYAFPLLGQVITQGGIMLEEEDDPLEQVALALDIIKFHSGECMAGVLSPTSLY